MLYNDGLSWVEFMSLSTKKIPYPMNNEFDCVGFDPNTRYAKCLVSVNGCHKTLGLYCGNNFVSKPVGCNELYSNIFNYTVIVLQEKSTTGKQGLGIKDKTKKIAGCYYQGKKTSFDDSDEDSADTDSLEKQAHDDLVKVEKILECKVKLKKLCKKILQQVSPIFCVANIFPLNKFVTDHFLINFRCLENH